MGRREWTAALLAVVLLGTGACRGSDEPAPSASGPSPRTTPSIDRKRYACDTWNTARRNFLDAVQRADITLLNPDATAAEIHDQAVEVEKTLRTLENAVVIAAANDSQNTAYWLLLLEAVQVTSVKFAGDDPQKIHAAMHKPTIEKYERPLLDRCRGHYSSPETGG